MLQPKALLMSLSVKSQIAAGKIGRLRHSHSVSEGTAGGKERDASRKDSANSARRVVAKVRVQIHVTGW